MFRTQWRAAEKPEMTARPSGGGARHEGCEAPRGRAAVSVAPPSLMAAQQRQKPDLLGGVVSEDPGKLRRDGFRSMLANAAHGHAKMLRLKHDSAAARAQMPLDRLDDLRRQCFLRLQALRKDIDKPRELGKADDARLGRVVRDMRHPEERHHVVLAM